MNTRSRDLYHLQCAMEIWVHAIKYFCFVQNSHSSISIFIYGLFIYASGYSSMHHQLPKLQERVFSRVQQHPIL